MDDPYARFPDGFFDRVDPTPDAAFYGPPRLVTHIDDGAIAALGRLYRGLGIDGDAAAPMSVLDLMSSWVSHFLTPPAELVVLGMNTHELSRNPAATESVVHDLNVDATLPFDDARFDAIVCCVSVDYLIHPIEVFGEVHRVLKPGGSYIVTFSNRCFPTKAIRGWLATDDRGRVAIVAEYFRRSADWDDLQAVLATDAAAPGDPLYAVWARRRAPEQ